MATMGVTQMSEAGASAKAKVDTSLIAELTEILGRAAYLTLYSMPNPANPNKPVLSLDPLGIIQVGVNEQLHRYPIDLAAGTRVGEAVATVAMHWTPIPESYVPVPVVMPPATALSTSCGQPFETMNGAMTYADVAGSGIHAFGHGRTYDMVVGGSPQLHLGAVVNALEGLGRLSGLQGTVLVNGHIKPPTGLSLCIVARFMDPDGLLKADTLAPLENFPNPDPDFGALMVLAEVDPNCPVDVKRDASGNITWETNEMLRLVDINWDVNGPLGLRSKTIVGPVVGTHKAKFHLSLNSPSDKYTSYPLCTADGVMTFVDRSGREIGKLYSDIAVGDAFVASLPGIPVTPYRFGGAGPILKATGDFEGAMGMMTVDGALTIGPHATSTLYIFRLYDPEGAIRSSMKEAWGLTKRVWPATTLSPADEALVSAVDESLAKGLELRDWWQQKDKDNTFADRFEIVQTYNPAETAYGFFDEAGLQQGALPVMGLLQETVFDRPKTAQRTAMKRQLREYVRHYFLRSTDYLEPEAYGGKSFGEPPAVLTGLVWKHGANPGLRGFGYSQWYYKTMSGSIGKFEPEDQYRVIDLRELGKTFKWIVLKVQIFNFKVPFKPFGENGPQIIIPLQEQTYVVLSKDFVVDRDCEYGLGYAILQQTNPNGLLAYGPGHFQAGFQTIDFIMDEHGTTRARLAFAVDRPEKVMNIPLDPVGFAYRLANTLTLGASGRLAASLEGFLPSFLTPTGCDPVLGYIALANGLTAGAAGEHFGISKAELERFFLVQHFQQHYQMITGALATYRSVSDWLAGASIPDWIRTGVRRL